MRFLLLLALASCSCAHSGKQVVFDDDSDDNEVGWVCVPHDDDRSKWQCVSIETFQRFLREAEHRTTDM